MKKIKSNLRKDTVSSSSFHVGIELELKAKSEGSGCHDDDACFDNRRSNARDNYESDSPESILMDHFGLSRDEARSLKGYFKQEEWIDDMMSDWDDDGCDEDECPFASADGDEVRDEIESALKDLVGNTSIKVVSDSSIQTKSGEVDAEVCWNYFASKETLKDNGKIIDYLTSINCKFDTSCGLHVNLNNYLEIPNENRIGTARLNFLFDFVGESRKNSNYCNNYGMSGQDKYSMIYNQGDRLEFRFFSPTLDAEKLNHYVVLANTVYQRLAGMPKKLPKKSEEYFMKKMIDTNGRDKSQAINAIRMLNNLENYWDITGEELPARLQPIVQDSLLSAGASMPPEDIEAIRMHPAHEHCDFDCYRGDEGRMIHSDECEAITSAEVSA